jgi:tRNA threonylcarbamoyl adenosine modification protein YjeE
MGRRGAQIALFGPARCALELSAMTVISPTFRAEIVLPDMAATALLAARIAPLLGVGDAVALWGDLGAGKTSLAREILRALGITEDVPSPTFTLVQTYETPRLAVAHYDLYRLKIPRELDELGFREALEDGAALVEWPERAPDYLPDETLHLRLSLEGETRRAKITGPERWAGIA